MSVTELTPSAAFPYRLGLVSTEQARRATCVAMAVDLFGSRGAPSDFLFGVGLWIYSGETE